MNPKHTLLLLLLCCFSLPAAGEEADAARGYRLLTEKAYLPPDFDQQTWEEIWQAWPEPLRRQAEQASQAEREKMALARYGLDLRPDGSGLPLQYVVDEAGRWSMNCFACHGGSVAGQVIPGLPNSRFLLQTLTEEARSAKLRLEKPLDRLDLASVFMPLGRSRGQTNAVMFGVILMAYRDAELNVHEKRPMPEMTHHDMDPPPWWHFHKKKRLYIDGFAEKSHRGLMQFLLVKQNGPEKFRQWEEDFRDIHAYLESLRPPKYPYEIDQELAAAGRTTFARVCAECHGSYGEKWSYPERTIPLEEIGTDPVRLSALTPAHRTAYGKSWFTEFGKQKTTPEPQGYTAPPLDGIWATAPYFHNGSVPTLWHLLHPQQRPAIWKRTSDEYDREKTGLAVETFSRLPAAAYDPRGRREFFITSEFGKSAAGHLFPNDLTPAEKRAVLEYLKTL